MKEDINNILKNFNKVMENYEIDKKFGQMSVDSIYHLFPSEITIIIDYIKYLESNWKELKKWLEENWEQSQDIWYVKIINKMQELESGNNE